LIKVRKRLGADFFREMESLTYGTLVEKKKNKTKKMILNARKKSLNFLHRNMKQAEQIMREHDNFS